MLLFERFVLWLARLKLLIVNGKSSAIMSQIFFFRILHLSFILFCLVSSLHHFHEVTNEQYLKKPLFLNYKLLTIHSSFSQELWLYPLELIQTIRYFFPVWISMWILWVSCLHVLILSYRFFITCYLNCSHNINISLNVYEHNECF